MNDSWSNYSFYFIVKPLCSVNTSILSICTVDTSNPATCFIGTVDTSDPSMGYMNFYRYCLKVRFGNVFYRYCWNVRFVNVFYELLLVPVLLKRQIDQCVLSLLLIHPIHQYILSVAYCWYDWSVNVSYWHWSYCWYVRSVSKLYKRSILH